MIYIICHDFKSTSGNHAGMRHLYEEIEKRKRGVKLYVLNKNGVGVRRFNRVIAVFLALRLILLYKRGDKFLFTEAFFRGSFHDEIIWAIKMFHKDAPIYAMAHLSPIFIKKLYSEKQIKVRANRISMIITLGSSLTDFFNKLGISNVHTSFHYVDTDYYFKKTDINVNKKPRVLVMGAMARDFSMLAEIVRSVPDLHFVICKGRKDIDALFDGLTNVTLCGFMPEDKLRNLMDLSDISLNVMDDTIGSNVICTSLAMGLAMVCSDVGSIRDYCDETNTIFCNTKNDFISALDMLAKNPSVIATMKNSAKKVSTKFMIDKYIHDIFCIIGDE